ncbi:hypothetical protein FPV67DRAFT_1150785 [Lyophyllum atratum]|nr:hypothetical protein FPV67DRAFT_1150785 [Lyophyllum atratum]
MILFVPLVALIVFSLVMNIYIPLQVSHVRNIPSLAFVESWAPTLDFCASSVIDFWLSFSLIYCLAKSGKRLDWADTGAVVLAAYALNTGIIASVFSLLPLITFAAMPDNLIFFAFKIVLTGLYVNSFLAMLNSRHYFQRPEALVRVSLPQGTMAYDRGIHHGTRPSHPVPTITDAPHDCTINEAGLPLFKPKNSSSGHSPHDIQLLEVKVGKEEHQDRGD